MHTASMQQILAFYATPAGITDAGLHGAALSKLPDAIADLVDRIQGLVIYDVVAADFYGYVIPPHRQDDIHLRPIEHLVDTIFSRDPRPLTDARPPEHRLVGRCHHYARLLVAVLRAKGIPARARCGFAAYLNPGWCEDHTVCEYWNDAAQRWVLVDAQIDAVWKAKLHITHDMLDVPRDQFLVAADAWHWCRTQRADPARFGITFADLHGLGFIAGSVVHDLAVLNKVEVLQWDSWGAIPRPDHALTDEQVALFDRVAELTAVPDAHFAELRALYESDERLRVPAMVYNALREQVEPITEHG